MNGSDICAATAGLITAGDAQPTDRELQGTTAIARAARPAPERPLPLRKRPPAGQYETMTKQENHNDGGTPGRKVKARMFLVTMLLLFAGTLGIPIYAVLRSVPAPS